MLVASSFRERCIYFTVAVKFASQGRSPAPDSVLISRELAKGRKPVCRNTGAAIPSGVRPNIRATIDCLALESGGITLSPEIGAL